MGFLDWASSKVQSFTGEADRRALVEEFKDVHSEHKETVHTKIALLNRLIEDFNRGIQQLNNFRTDKVKVKIENLFDFLVKFGNIESTITFADEKQKEIVDIPTKAFESTDSYIKDIDWSKDDVFTKTFFKTIFGVRSETRRQNSSMKEELNEFQMEIKSREKRIDFKQQRINTDKKIGVLYYSTIAMIDQTIEKKILPEMELVEAMLEAESIKNMILVHQNPSDTPMNKDISLLQGTIYDRHYRFVKNSFLFFILCKKIYNTPILTKLLNEETTNIDFKQLEDQKSVLVKQEKELSINMMKEYRHGA
ncbi:hypothetical protein [Bacillus sp. FJAT-29814]|uniref:hypothetical protein n=1 Tax=Bacillus sp. FJAT-29814 TaxID=1729688 RepID=UPI0008368067|nr:hypothetical protein [Bacillus sp. FJAT-29814]